MEVRDSKNPTGDVLTFAPDVWTAFLVKVREGGYDKTATPINII